MYELTNCTFLIPIRFDSEERIENINFVLRFLRSNFKTNIFLYEEAVRPYFSFFSNDVDKYKFFYSRNEYFHRTKIINKMIIDATTLIVVNYDSDVFLDVDAYIDAYNKLLNTNIDLLIPYKDFWNVDKMQTKKIINEELGIDNINLNICKKRRKNSVGGCIFFRRDSYIKGGMENENFRAWGAEDDERIVRFQKLGFQVERLIEEYNLYHLDHPRGINSKIHTSYYKNNVKELEKISNMNKEELEKYINTWKV